MTWSRTGFGAVVLLAGLLFAATASRAQEKGDSDKEPFGVYTPGRGFRVASTDKGELNIRVFTYLRYLNQKDLEPTFTDAFGTTTTLDRREDIQFQKVTIYFMGWLMSQKLHYNVYVWTANTSQGQGAQVVVGGNINYAFDRRLTLGGGVDALPGVRATEGNFPFWLTVDNRLMADEFFRPSYTMGVWARGALVRGLTYRLMLANNMSQLGVDAGQLDDHLNTVTAALLWMPTTGEFGDNGAFGDFEGHDHVATRLGGHFTSSGEDRQGQPNTDAFENVTIRLSDGNPIFTPNLFGPGIQIDSATYHMFSADAGIKYRGLALEGEYYWRWVNDFNGPGIGALGFDQLDDNGFQLQGSGMVLPTQLQAYAGLSKIFGQYGDPWDFRFGVNWFPWRNQVVRWNLECLHLDHSPVGGVSLPEPVGGTGQVYYSSFMLNF